MGCDRERGERAARLKYSGLRAMLAGKGCDWEEEEGSRVIVRAGSGLFRLRYAKRFSA
jgi:hypothetical protein